MYRRKIKPIMAFFMAFITLFNTLSVFADLTPDEPIVPFVYIDGERVPITDSRIQQ